MERNTKTHEKTSVKLTSCNQRPFKLSYLDFTYIDLHINVLANDAGTKCIWSPEQYLEIIFMRDKN